MPDNDKNIIPACGILGLYSEGYFRLVVAAPGLVGYGSVLFKHIYLTTCVEQEEGRKKYEVRNIIKNAFVQGVFLSKYKVVSNSLCK